MCLVTFYCGVIIKSSVTHCCPVFPVAPPADLLTPPPWMKAAGRRPSDSSAHQTPSSSLPGTVTPPSTAAPPPGGWVTALPSERASTPPSTSAGTRLRPGASRLLPPHPQHLPWSGAPGRDAPPRGSAVLLWPTTRLAWEERRDKKSKVNRQ